MKQRPYCELMIRDCFRWTCLIAIMMLSMTGKVLADDDSLSCARELNKFDFGGYDRQMVAMIQTDLTVIYQQNTDFQYAVNNMRKGSSGPLADDIIGPVTLRWINQFCKDFAVQEPSPNNGKQSSFVMQLVAVLKHFATIAKAYPDWKDILLSKAFTNWINSQTEARRLEIYQIRRSGSADQVISLLNQFPKNGTTKDNSATPQQIDPVTDDYSISYQLTDNAFQQIKAHQQIIENLQPLLDQSFVDFNSLWVQIAAIFQEQQVQAINFRTLVRQQTSPQMSLQLTDNSFAKLVTRLPDAYLQPITKLKNLSFNTKDDLTKAIRNQFTQPDQSQTNASSDDTTTEEQAASSSAINIMPTSAQLKTITAAAEQVPVYQLTQQTLDNLGASLGVDDLPQGLQDILAPLMNVDFARSTLFSSALKQELQLLQDRYTASLQSIELSGSSVTADVLEALKNKQFPDALIEILSAVPAQSSQDALQQALISAVQQQFTVYLASIAEITSLARQIHSLEDQEQVSWDGGGCGCLLDTLSGQVYGFYPFWLANAQAQSLDFSVLDRIGFYALSIDAEGNVIEVGNWPGNAEFINEARRYQTKIDLVIYKNWQQFVQQAGADVNYLDKVTTQLVEAIDTKLTNSLFNLLKPYVSLGTHPMPTQGDGITLYWEGFPTDQAGSDLLVDFIKKLRTALNEANPKFSLNLLMPMDEISHSPYSKDYWGRLIPGVNENQASFEQQNYLDKVLVFLPEGYSQNKKKLRQTIEDIFTENSSKDSDLRAIKRRNLLRKIIPVITYAYQDEPTITASLTYFEDNFAGVGLWPLAVDGTASDSDNALPLKINALLKQNYVKESNNLSGSGIFLFDYIGTQIDTMYLKLKDFVCVNRWTFRILFDITVILLLVSAYFYIYRCARHCFWCLPVLFLLSLLSFLILLFFDPSYKDFARGNSFAIFLVIVIFLMIRYEYDRRRKTLP